MTACTANKKKILCFYRDFISSFSPVQPLSSSDRADRRLLQGDLSLSSTPFFLFSSPSTQPHSWEELSNTPLRALNHLPPLFSFSMSSNCMILWKPVLSKKASVLWLTPSQRTSQIARTSSKTQLARSSQHLSSSQAWKLPMSSPSEVEMTMH